MDEQQAAEAAVWVTQFSVASERMKESADAATRAMWAGLADWYNEAATAAITLEAANMSLAGQQAITGAASQYVAATVGILAGVPQPIPTLRLPAVRRGANPLIVHSRPAEVYRRAIALGASPEEALARALNRAGGLTRTDMTLAERQAQDLMLKALGVTHYRRIVRPELSETGSCGLCIVAADRIYSVGNLLPIHPPSCKCITMPIVDGNDPGRDLNDEDLKRFYADAGSTYAADLRKTRYKVDQHGEYGPVLTRAEDSFRGPKSVALEDDPDRARRMLEQAAPVLTSMEERAAGGEDVTGPLAYQQGLVAKLRRITGD